MGPHVCQHCCVGVSYVGQETWDFSTDTHSIQYMSVVTCYFSVVNNKPSIMRWNCPCNKSCPEKQDVTWHCVRTLDILAAQRLWNSQFQMSRVCISILVCALKSCWYPKLSLIVRGHTKGYRSVGLESGVFVNSREFSLILWGFTDFVIVLEWFSNHLAGHFWHSAALLLISQWQGIALLWAIWEWERRER